MCFGRVSELQGMSTRGKPATKPSITLLPPPWVMNALALDNASICAIPGVNSHGTETVASVMSKWQCPNTH